MRLSCCFLLLLLGSRLLAQTGPAGVQSSATCVFWVKADAGTSSTVNATAISAWNDQSGNGIHLGQTTANLQPLYTANVINGFPAVQFDNSNGSNDKMTAADNSLLDNTAGYSFFMVTRPQNVDNNARCVISKRTAVGVDQSFMHFFYTGSTFYTDVQTNNDRYNTSMTFAANNNYLVTQQYDGSLAAASRCRTYVSSSLNVTASESSASIPDNNSPLVMASTDLSDNRAFGGYIAEVIIYRTALPAASRIIVENYLSAKYNITLLANDKYAGDTPANGDFDREVAGVGQESGSASSSFSSRISGGLELSVNSGLDNGDYLLAGHAMSTNSAITSDVGGMTGTLNSRWQRIWYVDVTNTSTSLNANVTFDMSDGGLSTPTLGIVSNYVLLYRPGNSGNWTELSTASSTSGDRVTFANINFTADGYYTLGTRHYEISPLPIELLYFTATPVPEGINFCWATASEKNSLCFQAEVSADAQQFEPIGTVTAAGNSHALRTYTFCYRGPCDTILYGRLRSVDKDLTSSCSPVISIQRSLTEDLLIYPNPAQRRLRITARLPQPRAEIRIRLFDPEGRMVMDQGLFQENGSLELSLPELKGGGYQLILSQGPYIRKAQLLVK